MSQLELCIQKHYFTKERSECAARELRPVLPAKTSFPRKCGVPFSHDQNSRVPYSRVARRALHGNLTLSLFRTQTL